MFHSPFSPLGVWRPQFLDPMYGRPPQALRPWLAHTGSLTAALKQLSENCFNVQLLCQRWQQPQLEERLALGLGADQRVLIREVLLYGCGQPWVYARSLLPECSLEGESRYLSNLGNRPLGDVLFAEREICRGPMVFNHLRRNPRCCLPALKQMAPYAWGRRSALWLRGRPLLVAEGFLSSFNPPQASLITGG
ncbi:MAG: chorismate lyase [Gammaproteobacteria bacterium]|nr:chorismate lyase [Gammaproteobacteria bacterium]